MVGLQQGFRACGLAVLVLAMAGPGAQARAQGADTSVLTQMIVVSRHGVRSPVYPNALLNQYSSQPFPTFPVAPGMMTPHGNADELLLGQYYRAYLVQQGLLTGNATADAPHLYFRANNQVQRSIDTAGDLAEAIAPGAVVPLHDYPGATPDPLFNPVAAGVAKIDLTLATASLAGEYGNDPQALATQYASEINTLQLALTGTITGAGAAIALSAQPFSFTPGTVASGLFVNTGGFQTLQLVTEPFLMEYVDGLPMSQVAFGHMTPGLLLELSNPRFLDMLFRAPYLARVQGSDMAYHIIRSLEQSVFHEKLGGGLGDSVTKMIALVGSDSHVTEIAGLFGLQWALPGYMQNYAALGGALVFELRHDASQHFFVRAYYQAQTFDQLRQGTELTLANPPARAPVFIPGASTSNATYDAPLEAFLAVAKQQIGMAYVQD